MTFEAARRPPGALPWGARGYVSTMRLKVRQPQRSSAGRRGIGVRVAQGMAARGRD